MYFWNANKKYILCMDGFSTERNNKDMKMKWYELARSRMKELGITQEKLAEELGTWFCCHNDSI